MGPFSRNDMFFSDEFTARVLSMLLCYCLLFGFGYYFIGKFTLFGLIYFSVIPIFWAVTVSTKVFRKQTIIEQVIYCSLATLLFFVPVAIFLPTVRTGWTFFIRLITIAYNEQPATWFMASVFFLWSFVDVFILKAFIQEALKFIITRRMLKSRLVLDHRGLIAYAIAVACVIAWVDAVRDVVGVYSYLQEIRVEGVHRHLQSSIVSHRKNVLWSFAVYHMFYSVPMHTALAIIIACCLAARKFQRKRVSCFQVLFIPVLLHGIPSFANIVLKGISRNRLARALSHYSDPASIDTSVLARLAALQTLMQWISLCVMGFCLLAAMWTARHGYNSLEDVAPVDVHKSRKLLSVLPSFPFTWSDVGLEPDTEYDKNVGDSNESLLDCPSAPSS